MNTPLFRWLVVALFAGLTPFARGCKAQSQTGLAPSTSMRVNFAAYSATSGVMVRQEGTRLRAVWPLEAGAGYGVLLLDLQSGAPLISQLAIAPTPQGGAVPLLRNVNPQTVLTVGTRDLTQPAGWVAFFDDAYKRPYQSYRAVLDLKSVRAVSEGRRTTIVLEGLTAGPFAGDLRFTLYPGTRLVHAQAVLSTNRDAAAILYDAGLSSPTPTWTSIAYLDNHDKWQRAMQPASPAVPVAVRNRAIIAESAGGAVAVFPPPHQYFYPLDFVDNLQFAWQGRNFHNLVSEAGFGIRQPPEGDRRHVPWINAPPRTQQKLSVFYLLTRGRAEAALREVKRFTHDDTFVKLDGYHTFSSHYHVEHTLDYVARQKDQGTAGVPHGLEEPDFVKVFKARGVDIVHLAEFHVGWTPELTAQRLNLLRTLHQECARLSGNGFLLLPGEEPNVHLGGHWLSFFPKPVYWTLERGAGQPFVEQVPGFGTVYHVGSPDDVLRLMNAEKGLMWTAHPRIKGSIGFPDGYRTQDFFLSPRFLGGAWKAMPADLSKPQLGTRVLDLQNEMANWGLHKYTPGEVDVFKIDNESELYAHMNINYLKLARVPRFEEGWESVLDALQKGQFFVTTGEVLVPQFSVGGKESGQTLRLSEGAKPALRAQLRWTFPPAFAEVISGDGTDVFRQRLDLSDAQAFGTRELNLPLDISRRRWVRLEVWDVAGNGAMTPPVWIETSGQPADATLNPAAKEMAPLNPPPASAASPVTWARFVPERQDDFAWENDLVAFRTFGPALRAGIENSGIDCFFKRVKFPVLDKWYRSEQNGTPYTIDNGEGYDGYGVGSSRGCGGSAIWKNGKLYLSDTFQSWKLVSRTPQRSVFELTYDYDMDGARVQEVKRITIELGQRLFKSESTFTRNGQPAVVDVAIGLTTHGGKATVTLHPQGGWMACWETIDGSGLGTGLVIDPARVTEMREIKSADPNEGHALLLTRTDAQGKVVWYSGYGWERAGAITTPAQWQQYLAQYRP